MSEQQWLYKDFEMILVVADQVSAFEADGWKDAPEPIPENWEGWTAVSPPSLEEKDATPRRGRPAGSKNKAKETAPADETADEASEPEGA